MHLIEFRTQCFQSSLAACNDPTRNRTYTSGMDMRVWVPLLRRVNGTIRHDDESGWVLGAEAHMTSFRLSQDKLRTLDVWWGSDYYMGTNEVAPKAVVTVSQRIPLKFVSRRQDDYAVMKRLDLTASLTCDVFSQNVHALLRAKNLTIINNLRNNKWSIILDMYLD
eukprot:jgi/Mesvir1/27479/Mv07254-RA.1